MAHPISPQALSTLPSRRVVGLESVHETAQLKSPDGEARAHRARWTGVGEYEQQEHALTGEKREAWLGWGYKTVLIMR